MTTYFIVAIATVVAALAWIAWALYTTRPNRR